MGLQEIKPQFLEKKIMWGQGQKYSTDEVDATQKRLLKTDLFSSVMITHAGEIEENGELPIKIHLTESKHRSLSLGISYATVDKFGFNFSWAHRNLRQLGEQLEIEADISQIGYTGIFTYRKPDFKILDQDFVLRGEALREDIYPYLAFTYGAIIRIDREFSSKLDGSWGLRGEYVDVTHSGNDGKFGLLSFPIFMEYSTIKHILNPSSGHEISYQAYPYINLYSTTKAFFKQKLILENYFPLIKNQFLILALRGEFGSILGPSTYSLPMTKLFLGGSDITLRGYRYRSVSPRNQEGKPIGGQGAIFFSIEPRIRLTSSIGLVPFMDLGTVSKKHFPDFTKKWYKSVGIGLRYFTFFGPLRFDVGFPLNRRDIDPKYRIYLSIGQTF